jgi:succinate dehydrogenase flavin-adding protein (antitoxin of CptAB toxin-antitoxin module)
MMILSLSRGLIKSCAFRRQAHKAINVGTISIRSFSEHEGAENLPGLTPEQIVVIGLRDEALRDSYKILEGTLDEEDRDFVRRKRMIYRSKQRGWLEADLLMGSWAVKYIPTLTSAELDEYELLLKEETIDIYNYMSGKDALPPHLENLEVMKKIQAYALIGNMASPEGYELIKRETNLT